MNVGDIKRYADGFSTMFWGGPRIQLEYSEPWRFNYSYQKHSVPFGTNSGVYVYSKPAEPSWQVPFELNQQDVWYIGKSNGRIGGRVWAHMGAVYEPGTRELCNPRFKYHDWHNMPDLPESVREALANGDVVVYTIKVEPVGEPPGLPKALQMYLLSCFYRATGNLPPLNLGLY